MKKLHTLLLTLALCMLSMQTQAQAISLQQGIDLNFGWRFKAGNVDNAASPQLDDASWRTVDLPHDFQIEQPWVAPAPDEKGDANDPAANIKSRLSSRGFKEMGKGWYRLHFTLPDSLAGKRLLLDFGGIMYVGDVYLNGELVGKTDYGYVGFEVDVTGKMKAGHDNVIAVMADTREPGNSRWYTGGGLFRTVRLVATDRDVYFARHPLRITTRENRYVSVGVEVVSRGRDKKMPLDLRIIAPDGTVAYQGRHTINRSTPTRTVEQLLPEIEIEKPLLWDTESPNLYTVEATLYNERGVAVGSIAEHFGIRTVEIGPDFGLKLNGKKVLLQGYANHHSLGALGAAAYPRAIEKRILLMKKWGINHIRTSHNPYSREFIELCDKHGILVVDELYDKWTRQHTGGRVAFEELWQRDVPEWVKRDRNSPSVIAWSLGNELQQDPNMPYNDWGVTMYRLMRPLVSRYDSTRRVTVAMHPRYRNWQTDSLPCDLAMQTDFQAYNYRYMYFPGDGRRFPWMTFYQSEASIAAMGQNYFEMNLDRVMGLAYWGAIDYLGESQGWPAKGWAQGVFDIALNPKPKAYYMKSFFCHDEPVVHIAVVERKGDQMWNGIQTGNDGMSDHWNRSYNANSNLNLVVYTNAEEVELLLNGKSLGTKQNPVNDPKQRNQLRWNNVTYQPGRLVAVARTGGKEVARHQIETTGEAKRLAAVADLQPQSADRWLADGMDLQHVCITALDSKGRLVQTTDQLVTFEVEGPARIVGVINGDINSEEMTTPLKEDGSVGTRRLYNGSCSVILRSTNQAGPVTLKVSAPGLKGATLKMQTQRP
jgi:beta-galactosidase